MRAHYLRNPKLPMVSYIAPQKEYRPSDCGKQITCGCYWIFKAGGTMGGGFFRFFLFSFLFLFLFDSSFGQAGGSKKKGNLLHHPAKETDCSLRSTVHTGARLSLRRLSLHAGRTLV